MNVLQQFVNNLSDEDRQQIIKDYDKFEHDGFIEDCILRTSTITLIRQLGANENMITLWMKELAFEIFREYAYKYIGLMK
jgi:hypothetical protein